VNALILGFYGKGNCGDECYKITFPQLFPQHDLIFTDHLDQKSVEWCDIIILGGGNVIRKDYLEQLSKIKNKKIYAFSAGVEEAPSQDLSFFKHIYTRDENSFKILSKQTSCTLLPDAAMILTGNPSNGLEIIKNRFNNEKNDLYSNIVTVVVNSYMLNNKLDGYARDAFNFIKFSYDFAKTLDEVNASFIFVPFCSQLPFDDRASNAWIASKCKYYKKNHIIFDRLSCQETLDIISASNLVISSRLHSSIFSYINGVPFIDITHHDKNKSFLNLVQQKENSISFWNFDSRILKNKIEKMMFLPKHTEHEKFRKIIWDAANEICFD